jgi:hypothetical protein
MDFIADTSAIRNQTGPLGNRYCQPTWWSCIDLAGFCADTRRHACVWTGSELIYGR